MNGPVLFGFLLAMCVVVVFGAIWKFTRPVDPVDERLRQYGVSTQPAASDESGTYTLQRRFAWPGVNRLLSGFGLGPRLATALTRADLPLTAAEFALIMLGTGFLGFLVGTLRVNLLVGLLLGALCAYLPFLYLTRRQRRRQQAFTSQLPDLLTLLVGGLRAGQGLSQALDMVVKRIDPPAATEFARVMRAIELGLPVQEALGDLSERVGVDDLDLVVTAINVQYEMGGNIAETLEVIADTVRDRIRILREIRVLTAQQRYTGRVLAVLPVVVGLGLFLLNPSYMRRLFEPGWIRMLPAAALVMQMAGFLVIRRIVDIEV